MKTLEEAALASKRVLVRIDADVPLSGTDPVGVLDDFRLQKLLPTLFYLINHRAKIILCGHLGRPGGQVVSSLSLKPVFLHLSALVGKKVLFATEPLLAETNQAISQLEDQEII